MQKQEWQHNIHTPIPPSLPPYFFAVLGITLRFSGWMFQPTGAISAMHFFNIAFIYVTHHYILLC